MSTNLLMSGMSRARLSLKSPSAEQDSSKSVRPRIEDRTNNGEKARTLFSEQELMRRQANLRRYMTEAELDACVLTSIHNVNYFSGFHYCGFGRSYALVITPDRSVTISAGIDGGKPWRRCIGDNVTYTDYQKDNFFYAVQQELLDVKGKVGLEFDHVTLDVMQKFDRFLTNSKGDVSSPTMLIRLIKSEEEIEVIREGARIANVGANAMIDCIAEGVSECDVSLAGEQAIVREIARTYPELELADTWAWFVSGINTDGGHNPPTSRKIQKGDILSLNCFPVISGYYAALERTMFFDHVSEDALRIWKINCLVHERGLQMIRPGVRCCDVALELNAIYEQHGLLKYRNFGYGHSFGVISHYYGREAAIEFREDVDTVLQPGMVVSIEPMITIPEGMPGAGAYREHDILIVTKYGSENITNFPYGPEHNIVRK